MARKISQRRKGQALLEYVFLIAGIAFICLVAVSVFGHKLADQYAVAAGMLPGAHGEDNQPIATGSYAEYELHDGAIEGTGGVSWLSVIGEVDESDDLQNNVITQGRNDGEAFVAEHDHDHDD